jgi:hypothetical protein
LSLDATRVLRRLLPALSAIIARESGRASAVFELVSTSRYHPI